MGLQSLGWGTQSRCYLPALHTPFSKISSEIAILHFSMQQGSIRVSSKQLGRVHYSGCLLQVYATCILDWSSFGYSQHQRNSVICYMRVEKFIPCTIHNTSWIIMAYNNYALKGWFNLAMMGGSPQLQDFGPYHLLLYHRVEELYLLCSYSEFQLARDEYLTIH